MTLPSKQPDPARDAEADRDGREPGVPIDREDFRWRQKSFAQLDRAVAETRKAVKS